MYICHVNSALTEEKMIRETIEHKSEAEWLGERAKDITSTEAAALFNAGVYTKTFYELYHLKSGTFPPAKFESNDRIRWGTRLEDAIAHGIAEDLGLIVEPFKVYMRIVEASMGSSFDFKIVGLVDGADENEAREMFRTHGPGIMECKNVDGLQFRRAWIDDGETIEAPVHIEFQTQHQLEVADLGWAIIAPLVGGNTPKPVIRLRDRAAGEAIRAKVMELWQRVNAGAEPEPDFTKDGDTISQVYLENDGSSIDLSHDKRLAELCRTYKSAAKDIKTATEVKDAAKAEIMTIIKHAKSIAYAGGKISAGTNKPSFRAYYRDEYEKISISLSTISGVDIQASVPPFRNVRITEDKVV
jgi:predicted phage-related endonuclease